MSPADLERHEALVRAPSPLPGTVGVMLSLHKLRVVMWGIWILAPLLGLFAVLYAVDASSPVLLPSATEAVCSESLPCELPAPPERSVSHGERFSFLEFGSVRSITLRPLDGPTAALQPRFTGSWFDTSSVPPGRYEMVLLTESGKIRPVLLTISPPSSPSAAGALR